VRPIVCLNKIFFLSRNQSIPSSLTLLVFLFFFSSSVVPVPVVSFHHGQRHRIFLVYHQQNTTGDHAFNRMARGNAVVKERTFIRFFPVNEQSWKSINIREGTNVTVTHAGDSLVLTGTFKCKPVFKKLFPLKGFSWKQMIPFDLVDLAFSAASRSPFTTVALMGPYALKLSICGKRIGDETIFLSRHADKSHAQRADPKSIFGRPSVAWLLSACRERKLFSCRSALPANGKF